MRNNPKAPKRIKRLAARRMILDLANVARMYPSRTLTMKHLQLAVFRVRQHALVAPELLEQAGFRAKASR